MSTLATVSTTTMAIKSLVNSTGDVFSLGYQYAGAFCEGSDNKAVAVDSEHMKFVGYSGLMLPVMEDMLYTRGAFCSLSAQCVVSVWILCLSLVTHLRRH